MFFTEIIFPSFLFSILRCEQHIKIVLCQAKAYALCTFLKMGVYYIIAKCFNHLALHTNSQHVLNHQQKSMGWTKTLLIYAAYIQLGLPVGPPTIGMKASSDSVTCFCILARWERIYLVL